MRKILPRENFHPRQCGSPKEEDAGLDEVRITERPRVNPPKARVAVKLSTGSTALRRKCEGGVSTLCIGMLIQSRSGPTTPDNGGLLTCGRDSLFIPTSEYPAPFPGKRTSTPTDRVTDWNHARSIALHSPRVVSSARSSLSRDENQRLFSKKAESTTQRSSPRRLIFSQQYFVPT